VRLIGIVLLVVSVIAFVIELKAPGLGIWGAIGVVSLLLGGWFLYDRSGGVQVSPVALIGVAVGAALFFGIVIAKVMQVRNVPPAQGPMEVVGHEGVALGAGVDARGGLVRVASEEWRAVSKSGSIAGGHPVKVIGLDGLVLTVEPLADEHAPGAQAPAREGGSTE
jgi:membrane-bound serine protease (ClpP class)